MLPSSVLHFLRIYNFGMLERGINEVGIFKQLQIYYWPGKLKYLIMGSIVFLMISTGLGVVYPYMLKYLVDEIITKSNYENVWIVALIVFGVIVIKAVFLLLHGVTASVLGNQVAYNMRKAAYEKLQYLSFQYYDKTRTGDLMSRLTGDLDALRLFIGAGFAQILNMFFMIFFGTAMMITIHWKLMLITLVTLPFLVFIAFKYESRIHTSFRDIRKAFSDLTTSVQENITGVRTVKSFARESFEVEKFSVHNAFFRDHLTAASSIWARFLPFMELMANLSVVILVAVGSYFVTRGEMTLGDLLAFFTLIWFIITPLWSLGVHINSYTQSKASGERILQVFNQFIHVKDKQGAKNLQSESVNGHVIFQDVTFAYPENPHALIHFSVDAPPGKIIGLLGPTGSGKSTVIQLLFRAYNVKEGRILLDGHDIQDVTVESLRRQIAVVFQETFLFSSTIRNNIAYGIRDVSLEQVMTAAKLARAHEFIMELPDGYDTIVGERGLGLSGGQKQRIAIARALIADPKVLILDDSTSAVDMETEHEIQLGLREVMKGRTTIIIAHRISSLKHADEIIVLDRGHTIQRGTHEELIEQAGRYRETYAIQYADHPNFNQGKQQMAREA